MDTHDKDGRRCLFEFSAKDWGARARSISFDDDPHRTARAMTGRNSQAHLSESLTRQSRYGDSALLGIQARANKNVSRF